MATVTFEREIVIEDKKTVDKIIKILSEPKSNKFSCKLNETENVNRENIKKCLSHFEKF